MCADELAIPIMKLRNLSVSLRVFPRRWKRANIVSLHKKADKKDSSNNKCVSLLPLFGAILERVVYDELFRHVVPVLSQHQHGFIPRRSWSINLCAYLKHAWEAMSHKYQVDTIYTNFSSVFQSVNHTLLKQARALIQLERSCSAIVHLIFVRQTSESHPKRRKKLQVGNQ